MAKFCSSFSVNEILQDRTSNPFQILSNLGFGSGDQGDELCERIPLRFLTTPSQAQGIELDDFLKKNPQLKEQVLKQETLGQPFSTHLDSVSKTESSESSGLSNDHCINSGPAQSGKGDDRDEKAGADIEEVDKFQKSPSVQRKVLNRKNKTMAEAMREFHKLGVPYKFLDSFLISVGLKDRAQNKETEIKVSLPSEETVSVAGNVSKDKVRVDECVVQLENTGLKDSKDIERKLGCETKESKVEYSEDISTNVDSAEEVCVGTRGKSITTNFVGEQLLKYDNNADFKTLGDEISDGNNSVENQVITMSDGLDFGEIHPEKKELADTKIPLVPPRRKKFESKEGMTLMKKDKVINLSYSGEYVPLKPARKKRNGLSTRCGE